MERPSVSKSFLSHMKCVRDDIQCVWNDIIKRFQIIHTDKETKNQRIVMTIQGDDGEFRQPDMRDVLHLANNVAWEWMDAYRDPKELWDKVMNMKIEEKDKKRALRQEYLKWWNKDHKKSWRRAIENLRRGYWSMPKPQKEPKIIVDTGGIT